MIKGVSRYAVEIDQTDSPFFEKVICFVRPQYADGHAVDLHREAEALVSRLGSHVEEAQSGSRCVLKVPARLTDSLGQSCPAPPSAATRNRTRPQKSKKLPPWVPLALSAGGGAAAAMVITALL